jgi:hypothetical protein
VLVRRMRPPGPMVASGRRRGRRLSPAAPRVPGFLPIERT